MKQKNAELLVKEVFEDFQRRKEERSRLEASWLMNINFLMGNQYCELASNGEIFDNGKQYYWQQREVFNHIAPIIETRLAKFSRLKSRVSVRPATSDAADTNCAKFATRLIESVEEENNLKELIHSACFWSEVTGTAFYKVVWNSEKGSLAAQDGLEKIYEGDVEISVCPPYEIYPDSIACSSVEECSSIIHAKAYPINVIEDIWGVKVDGKEVSVINIDTALSGGGYGYNAHKLRAFSDLKKDHELVIERYTLPNKEHPDGRLTIIAGDKLLYDGDLPYQNQSGGKRGFPFIRQVALAQPSCFYGISIIERLIPIQRAYNTVKNRKHEYLNRLSLGVMAVEEGSIDLDNLEDEGLAPGKVLIYRQGSNPPMMMNPGTVPSEFRNEEDRLLAEFINISGVSDFLSSSNIVSDNLSGVALSLLIEQDDTRLSITAEAIRNSVRKVGQHILRLYRQFATTKRLKRISGENGEIERLSFSGSDITSDDLVFDTENELNDTPANRKNMAIELLKLGLLTDENGNISPMTKNKILEIMGFGNWETARCLDDLHIKKASKENQKVSENKDIEVDESDKHSLHIEEHIRCLIGNEFKISDKQKDKLNEHIKTHRQYERLTRQALALQA
ncbi:MAG: hypothetical protein QM214_01615 [Bacillota bacterium]|jgi:hypothetical protein|nr:hypothetical protein [Bacillota bacterium]HHU43796.1 hypothetical protein [Clostridiales bacterium]